MSWKPMHDLRSGQAQGMGGGGQIVGHVPAEVSGVIRVDGDDEPRIEQATQVVLLECGEAP